MAAVAGAIALAMVSPAVAQQNARPADERIVAGPVGLTPVVRILNVGVDDNVFSESRLDTPVRDFTTTFSPSVDASLNIRRIRATGRTRLDFVYFRDLTHLRSLDTDNTLRVDVPLSRLTVFAAGAFANARHKQDVEIDAPIRRVGQAASAGAEFALTGKVTLRSSVMQSRIEYHGDATYLESDLSRLLDRSTSGESAGMRYAVTPLTSFTVDVERVRDRFTYESSRDSDTLRVMPGVEFSPFALVSGRMAVGMRRQTFHEPGSGASTGTAAQGDLQYTLLGRTRFQVSVLRDLSYSYRVDAEQYLQTSVDVSVTQRLGASWDVQASAGRARLTYVSQASEPISLSNGSEVVSNYGLDLGYRVGRSRLGLQGWYRQRDATTSPRRDFTRTRLTTSFTYAF